MNTPRCLTVLACAMMAYGLCAAAEEGAGPVAAENAAKQDILPKVELPSPLKANFHVKEKFAGPDGLIGLVLEDEHGERAVAWATPGGRHVIIGEVVSPDGVPLTRAAMERRGIRPRGGNALSREDLDEFRESLEHAATHPVSPDALYGQALGLAGKVPLFDGIGDDGPPPVLVFFDPACPHCKRLFEAISADRDRFVEAGRQVWFIPVWLLSPGSLDLGASVLSGALSMDDAEAGKTRGPADPGYRRMVMENTVVFASNPGKPPQVPLVLWRNTNDGPVQIASGEMPDGKIRDLAAGRLEIRRQ